MCAEFLKIALFVAGQKKMPKIYLKCQNSQRPSKIKKYVSKNITFGFNFIFEMSLIFLHVKTTSYFPMTEILNLLHFEMSPNK